MILPVNVMTEIHAHAAQDAPREACGVVVIFKGRHKYIPCRNIAERNEHFVIHPEDWARAEDIGTPAVVVHSHPNMLPEPSQADLIGCERSGLPWLIVNWPVGSTKTIEPCGYHAPLIGREFLHGVLDCFTLIQDYYREVLGVTLETPHRADEWWAKGDNLYLDNYAAWGFERVTTPALHDVLLMQVGASVPNHGAIWLGDGCILHHQMGRLSSRDVYGGWYQKITTHIMRHRSQMEATC